MKGTVTTILRGFSYEKVRCVCEALCQSEKIKNVEITLNTPNAYETIEKIAKEFKDRLSIGAGTVKTFDELKKVIDCGIEFVLSPCGYTKEMIDYCHDHNVIAIPAAFTPSEIFTQYSYGADIIKVFPANELSKGYAKKAMEPLGDIPLMAVGGVNATNVKEHFDGGYKYVGTCWGLFKKEDVENMNMEGLVNSIKEFEARM